MAKIKDNLDGCILSGIQFFEQYIQENTLVSILKDLWFDSDDTVSVYPLKVPQSSIKQYYHYRKSLSMFDLSESLLIICSFIIMRLTRRDTFELFIKILNLFCLSVIFNMNSITKNK